MPLTVLPPRLACWGDSLTTFVVPFLAQALHGQYLVENYAVGGQDSSQILSRFTAAPSTHGVPTILWAGSNNLPELSMPQALADLATMVGSLTSDYLILTPFNGENGPSYYRGGATYQQLQTFLTAVNATYPGHVFDARAFMIANATSSAQDVIDVGHDIIPSSTRRDTVHPTDAMAAELAQAIAQVVTRSFTMPASVITVPWYPVSTGRIGLGTDSPITRLHIDANAALGALVLSNSGAAALPFVSLGISGQASGMITGDVLGDACVIANTTGRLRVSANNGGRTDFAIRNSDGGIELPGGILQLGNVTLTAAQLTALLALL